MARLLELYQDIDGVKDYEFLVEGEEDEGYLLFRLTDDEGTWVASLTWYSDDERFGRQVIGGRVEPDLAKILIGEGETNAT